MFTKLNQFFSQLAADSQPKQNEVSLEIACAVLLCEVMRADSAFTESEQNKVAQLLIKQFSLTEHEVDEILQQAVKLSENASDFYQFTSQVNQHYTLEQRIEIVSLLWQVAYADGELASIEEHIIRKIADLLHLRHSEYIATKISAQSHYERK
ncbi:TerB family tellurite resistance protein [Litorilituus sediminis]|uniref:TerB family tellurite resistance protein n=1 Tax=Litorilituus sediminis TaxID=718192 RepID=A0A4P6PBC1_9GAMM|nr:TerB family tellurite resistance protein [Litorilituus sediminis]QBG36982.1 TerB family tellurite resistance protein [Litorilituus sediminis]